MSDWKNKAGLVPAILLLVVLAVSAAPASAQPPDAATYRLIGVIESGGFTGAVIGDPSGAQTFYRLREELPDGSRIIRVAPDSIRVRRTDGTAYELFIVHDTKANTPSARLPFVQSAPPVAAPYSVPQAPNRTGGARMAPDRRRAVRSAVADRQDEHAAASETRGTRQNASPRGRQAQGER